MMSKITKNFDILAASLSVLHNYFDAPPKLFSNQSVSVLKFLDTSAKSLSVTIKYVINVKKFQGFK